MVKGMAFCYTEVMFPPEERCLDTVQKYWIFKKKKISSDN